MPSESSFWIVSVPVSEEKSREQMIKDLRSRLVKDNAIAPSEIAGVPFPDFTVHELPKNDAFFASVLSRIVDTLRALFNDDEQALNEHLVIDGESVGDYVMNWHWDASKYRADRQLPELVEMLDKEMHSIDNVMKQKLTTYNGVKGQLQQLERKKNGNISVRSLADVVHKDDIVDPNSEFLETLLIAIPNTQVKAWLSTYEHLTKFVVPRSSSKICEDSEYALFNVTIFKRVHDEFVQKAREHKFQVREFAYDEAQMERERQELEETGASEKELWTELVRLSRTNFADAYQAMIHFKVLRTFVESVLRFGLPADYVASVLCPNAGRATQLIKALNSEYSYLQEYARYSSKDTSNSAPQDTPGEFANLLEQEVFPFVLTEQPIIIA
ncbi:Vma5p [Malassezia vespertilionis]|uniref:V-type proton ATPase subunit C n=1 Tax=Malassezia vespertilionis TaxID=2020962 RepID=A0A2N1JF59_9BASI|nr:Vma5p [Malassezia vespertilionis]